MYFIKTIGRNIDKAKWKAYSIIMIHMFAGVEKCMYTIRGVG